MSVGAAAERLPAGDAASPRAPTLAVGPAETVPLAGSLTIVVPVADVGALGEELQRIDQAIKMEDDAPFAPIVGLHVARWVLLPARVRGQGIEAGPSLVMWLVFDGTHTDQLTALVKQGRALLDRVYVHCVGYPTGGDTAAVRGFLLRHAACGPVAAYDGTPGRSLAIIRRQDELAAELAAVVRAGKATGLPNQHVFLEAQRFVDGELQERKPELARFARQRLVVPPPRWLPLDAAAEAGRVLRSAGNGVTLFVVLGLATVVLLGCLLGLALSTAFGLTPFAAAVAVVVLLVLTPPALISLAAVLWVLLLWRTEAREALRWVPVSASEFKDHHEWLKQRDNEGPGMNRMTILTDVKPGFMRHVMMHAVLGIIALRARRNLAGALQGVETIHFAEWRLVDGGRRLLFMSNYDGDALDYLFDFSHHAAPGVNAIWGNTEGFPPTRNLVGDGSRDVEPFQNAARVHQIATDVWYCGYASRRFITQRINGNWWIHEQLNAFPAPAEVDAWVETLERRSA